MGRDTCRLPERCLDCEYTTNGRIVVSYAILCTRAIVLYVNSVSAPTLHVQDRSWEEVAARSSAALGRCEGGSLHVPPTILSSRILNQVRLSPIPQSGLNTHTSMPTYLAFPLPFLFASSCGHCTKHLSTTLLSIVPLKLIFFTLAQDST